MSLKKIKEMGSGNSKEDRDRPPDAEFEKLRINNEWESRVFKMQEENNRMMQEFRIILQNLLQYLSKPPEKPMSKDEDIQEAIKKARLKLGLNDTDYYNFAFAGRVKAGKSSLINAIRGLSRNDSEAAAVDYTECTDNISLYTFPKYPHVRLYDIPGSGTTSHNSETYFSDTGLGAFDCLIIMIQQALCREDITFALQAQKFGQSVVFVRSKCDVDLDNDVKDESIDEITQEEINKYIKKMAQKYKEQIDLSGVESLKKVPCYFVSAISMRKMINGKADFFYQERLLLEYIIHQSKHSRNIIDESEKEAYGVIINGPNKRH